MNVTAQLTLDGLVRALRWKAHALAEDVEDRYRREAEDDQSSRVPGRPREPRDDRPGR